MGSSWTYPDLSLFQLVEGLDYAFPKQMKSLANTIPLTLNLRERRGWNFPKLLNIFTKQKAPGVQNKDGIFRHYPELDEQMTEIMPSEDEMFVQTITPVTHDLGDFKVNRTLPARERTMVGPFIFVDELGPGRLPERSEKRYSAPSAHQPCDRHLSF